MLQKRGEGEDDSNHVKEKVFCPRKRNAKTPYLQKSNFFR
jgi:hypothetical protein